MKKKNIIIGLLLVLIISLSLVFLNPNLRKNFKKIFASISDAEAVTYNVNKQYELNSEVYYNPVSNTWCQAEDEENNCYAWYVLGDIGSKIELFMKKDLYPLTSELSNYSITMESFIDNITSTWSDELTITNEKYKSITSIYPSSASERTIDFSNSKARVIFQSQISTSFLSTLKNDSICGVSGYPCLTIYNRTNEETSSNWHAWGLYNTGTSNYGISSMGPLQLSIGGTGYYIHPIIEVTKETYEVNITPKEIFNDERNYLVGLKGVVYLDPTDLSRTCTKSEADANVNNYGTPTEIKEGCMKWYIIGESGDSYKLFLNHNTTALSYYNSTHVTNSMKEAWQNLDNDTSNWEVSARIISMEDIGEAVGVEYSQNVNPSLFYLSRGLGDTHKSHFAYLMDYLDTSYSYRDNNRYAQGDGYGTSRIEAYWTSTPYNSQEVKTVDETGSITNVNSNSSATAGIRPLITLPKTVFYEGIDVTFNDENRMTYKTTRYNSKIEEIESQGKTGYLFDYWSLERDGEPFDFDTKVTSNTTLYAVYKTRNCITESYTLGQIVYFDPVTNNKCDETTFSIDNINNGTSTCYKWRVISIDDSLDKNNVELMLDHNLINTSNWSNSSDTFMPDKALSDLAALTSSWTKVKNLDYSYDTTIYESEARNNYGLLKCINGTCTITKDGNTTNIATNVKARMITIEEIINMINTVDAIKIWAFEPTAPYTRGLQSLLRNSISLDHQVLNNFYFTTPKYPNSLGIQNSNELSWLGENTRNTLSYPSATNNAYGDNNTGYYTLSPYPLTNSQLWTLYPDNMSTMHSINQNTGNEDGHGVRPVIQLEKENLCKNVLVTYNDEDRIEEEEIEINTQALNKDSKGKEGHTFKYWSLEKSGTEFDFDTPITHNTTLYAVYEIKKFNVEFYDDNTKIKTVVINYKNTINNTDVPTVSKEGYSFTAWSLENEEEGFDFTTEITKDLKLYSNYKVIENEVIFNDENRITTKVVVWGKKVTPLDNLGKEGYTFKYWSLEKNGTKFDFDTQIKSSTTLYAVYEIITYDVEFYVDNEIVETLTIDYNGVINENDIPNAEKETYKFLGWREEDSEDNFDFDTHILKNYKLYSYYEPIIDPVPDDECSLDITSSLYRVDNKKFVISLVPKDETIEQIVEHLTIQATLKEVSGEKLVICCEDETRVYTIERYWMPHTGNIVFRYGTIITLIILPIMLLVFINKQRTKNKELKCRL